MIDLHGLSISGIENIITDHRTVFFRKYKNEWYIRQLVTLLNNEKGECEEQMG